LGAARRIRERGKVIDNNRLRKHMLRAVDAANAERAKKAAPGEKVASIKPFQLGALRHSVATWLTQAGVPLEQVSRYLGHASSSTTRRHYVDQQAAALVLPQRVLRVV
jgi:integrase